MAKTACKAWKNGEVKHRGQATLEWYKDGVPQYYCYGYYDSMTDELIETCKNCRDNERYAQEDLEAWLAQEETRQQAENSA